MLYTNNSKQGIPPALSSILLLTSQPHWLNFGLKSKLISSHSIVSDCNFLNEPNMSLNQIRCNEPLRKLIITPLVLGLHYDLLISDFCIEMCGVTLKLHH